MPPTCTEYEKKVANAAFQFASRLDGGMELTRILLSLGKVSQGCAQMRDEFKALDANGDGTISLEEMMNKADHFAGISKKDIESFFHEADIEHNNAISFTEFVVFYSFCYLLSKNRESDITVSPRTRKKNMDQRKIDESLTLEQVSIGKMDSGEYRQRMNRLRSTTSMSGLGERETDKKQLILRKMHEVVCGAWRCFDADNDGILTLDELQTRLHDSLSHKAKHAPQKQQKHTNFFDRQRFKEMDANGNGSVTFPEFLGAFVKWAGADEEEEEEATKHDGGSGK